MVGVEAGRLILVVEDNAVNRNLARALLVREGFAVAEVGSIAEAVALLTQTLPALILLDLGLPDGDGLDLVRRLKAEARTAAVPVVALTAYAMESDRQRALMAGCAGFISKPIDTRAFPVALASAIAGSNRDIPGGEAHAQGAGGGRRIQ